MRELLGDLLAWWERGQPVGLGTVVATFRSAPRPPGASMLVGPDGSIVGSVSGGCVEAAVYELAAEVRDGRQPTLQRYGVTDDDAFAIGLTCGGILDIFVERIDRSTFPDLDEVAASVAAGEPVAVVTCVSGPPDRLGRRLVLWPARVTGSLGSLRLDAAVGDDVRGLLVQGRNGTVHYGHNGQRRGDDLTLFVSSYSPPPRMLVFGAIDFAAAVTQVGALLGYQVTVCDARATFATSKRFPDAHEVIVDWPHRYLERTSVDERTVICVLTHDPKFDVPLLQVALATPASYIGAMGSRRTHDERLARLRAADVSEADLARLHSPIGLDLGARTPEETAVSIAAEIVASRWGGTGQPLGQTGGTIHRNESTQPATQRATSALS